ncbi:hypothetical protein OMAG_000586 [Candidatus Omnitrophus magneticus]|uniref:Uncharacterized protein n=1 Tax=Candidatus Omnitrophus magneticus TaxID=1609969 RepID=A0A0F0CVF8_9BACT|nr:hypothetical protein OMAG_000586 [Candidatus Omnitrophus magneticus]
MTHSDNFKLVIEAIEAERSKTASAGLIELRQTKENKLNTVPINHILNILRDLEFGARVLKITKENRPDKPEEPWPQLWDPRKVIEAAFNSGISFSIQILDTYEEWFANYTKDLASGQKPLSPPEVSSKPVLKLPANAKWEDITIKFIDGHNVDIKLKNKTIRSDYKEMGFEDSKSRRPNKQWEMLQRLAENHGEISWEKFASGKSADIRKTDQDFGYEFDEDSSTPQNKGFSIIKAPDKLKKTKQLLAQTLKAFFHIDEDPFWPYEEVKSYKIKIKLIA